MAKISAGDVEAVWVAWRDRQANPGRCLFTEDRKTLIRKRLKLGYKPEHLALLFRYAHESPDRGPRWWRGENPERTKYLGLDQLLREAKLADRVQDAMEWEAKGARAVVPDTAGEPVARRGRLALYRGGRE